MVSVDPIINSLRARGHLMNAARTAVLRGLAGVNRPLDAEELRLEAARFHPVSRATVSRTLTFLRVAGVARPLPRTEGRTLYEIIPGGQEAPAALQVDDAGRSAAPPQKDGAGEDVSIEALAAVLRAGGYQMNPERVAILRAFVSAGRPVHAEELLAETRRHISVSRATVSRTLKLFHQRSASPVWRRETASAATTGRAVRRTAWCWWMRPAGLSVRSKPPGR